MCHLANETLDAFHVVVLTINPSYCVRRKQFDLANVGTNFGAAFNTTFNVLAGEAKNINTICFSFSDQGGVAGVGTIQNLSKVTTFFKSLRRWEPPGECLFESMQEQEAVHS